MHQYSTPLYLIHSYFCIDDVDIPDSKSFQGFFAYQLYCKLSNLTFFLHVRPILGTSLL